MVCGIHSLYLQWDNARFRRGGRGEPASCGRSRRKDTVWRLMAPFGMNFDSSLTMREAKSPMTGHWNRDYIRYFYIYIFFFKIYQDSLKHLFEYYVFVVRY